MNTYLRLKYTLPVPIKETVKEINSNTWLIGPFILHRSSGHSEGATWYDEEDNSSYTITDTPNPPPAATLLPPSGSPIVKVSDIADCWAVWNIGNKVVCKVQIQYPEFPRTPEIATIKWVEEKQPPFQLPQVIRYIEHEHRSILIYKRLPGQTLGDAWPSLSTERRHFYVKTAVESIKGMAEWKGDKICSVDGQYVLAFFLAGRQKNIDQYTPENLEKTCRELGIDCSTFCFAHAALSPSNVIVDGDNVGFTDWEHAGFFP